jgi:hypothetical protein
MKLKLRDLWIQILYGAFALVAFISTTAAAPLPRTFGTVAPASLEAWRAFREAQPFQTQLIAVSAPSKGKPRTLILSEPPPRTT